MIQASGRALSRPPQASENGLRAELLNPNGGTPGTRVGCPAKGTGVFGEMIRVGVMRWGNEGVDGG